MPSRNDEPPRDDSWDATYCAYPGCQNLLPETPSKHDPYCGIECETQAIIEMEREADAYAEAMEDAERVFDEWEKEKAIARVEGMY